MSSPAVTVRFPGYDAELSSEGVWRVTRSDLPERRGDDEERLNRLYPVGARPPGFGHFPHHLVAQATAAVEGEGGEIERVNVRPGKPDRIY